MLKQPARKHEQEIKKKQEKLTKNLETVKTTRKV